jgi:hypothetical protein
VLTLFELFNGLDGHGRMAGRSEAQTPAEVHWHDELNRYVDGQRNAPVFAVAGSDVKTFFSDQQDGYVGNYVEAARFDRPAIESATLAGRLTVAGAAHVRLLLSVTDAEGNIYLPGNRIVGPGPYRLHVEAWCPKPLTHMRIVDPGGVKESFSIDSQKYFVRDVKLDSLPPLYWFYVLVRGDDTRTTAISNPMFVGVR